MARAISVGLLDGCPILPGFETVMGSGSSFVVAGDAGATGALEIAVDFAKL